MNRQQRRAATKQKSGMPPVEPSRNSSGPAEAPRPGLLLRLAAFFLLSSWVLARVKHPQVLAMLREVARQAGRNELLARLDSRLE